MYPKLLTPQELCNAIYSTVFEAEKPLSRREICDAIERKKSPHILDMIEHLVKTGYFQRFEGKDKRGFKQWIYSAAKKNEPACTELEAV